MPLVYLVRHGETEWNLERRIQGQSDSPLTQKGEHQVRMVVHRMSTEGLTHVITSDLGRARGTAEIISAHCGSIMITDARLRELHMGILEGRQIETLSKQEEQWRKQMVDGTPSARIPGGESMEELAIRMRAALDYCLKLPSDSRILMVSHGIALGCLLGTLLGLPASAERRLRLRNCSLSRVDYQQSLWLASGWIIESAGDISHLNDISVQ